MKTNNRPKIKLVEWEVRTKSDFLLWNSPDDTAIWDGERTGNTREVERPMYDTEYIEYLEKEVNERTIVARNLMGNSLSLQRENQELKDNNEALAVEFNRLNEVLDKERQDQLLKVVESVFEAHITIYDFDMLNELETKKCKCGSRDTSKEHLLQEIRKELNNGQI